MLSVKLFEGVPPFLSIYVTEDPPFSLKYRAHAHTRGYFTWIERFADVVVGPSIETFYFVAFLSPGRDDDDWDVRPAAYLANNIYSVSVRQAQIKKD